MPVRVHKDGLKEGYAEITAELRACVRRAGTGVVEDLGVISRMLVTNAFLAVLMHSMTGTAADLTRLQNYKYHEWGTNTAAESATDTKCITPAATTSIADSLGLDVGTQVYGATSYTSVATLTSSASGTTTISEHCIHPTSTDGIMGTADAYGLDRSKFTGIALGQGDAITFTYTLSATGS